VSRPAAAPDRASNHRDGVLGGDRVLQGCGVQHPPHPDQPHLAGEFAGDPEDPIRILRTAQPGPQIHQHRVREAGRLLPSHRIGYPGRIAPTHVEGEAVGRLSVAQSFQPLQDHDHGQDRGWHRAAPGGLEQVGEQLGWEQPGPLPGQEPVHRALGQGRLAPAGTNGGSSGRRSWRPRVTTSPPGPATRPGVCQLSESTTNRTQTSSHLVGLCQVGAWDRPRRPSLWGAGRWQIGQAPAQQASRTCSSPSSCHKLRPTPSVLGAAAAPG